jgi:hypothetical protein
MCVIEIPVHHSQYHLLSCAPHHCTGWGRVGTQRQPACTMVSLLHPLLYAPHTTAAAAAALD